MLASMGSGDSALVPGRPAGGPTATVDLRVTGMHCGSCAALVEEALAGHPATRRASVDLDAGRATVDYDPRQVTVAELCAVVGETGYTADAGADPA